MYVYMALATNYNHAKNTNVLTSKGNIFHLILKLPFKGQKYYVKHNLYTLYRLAIQG